MQVNGLNTHSSDTNTSSVKKTDNTQAKVKNSSSENRNNMAEKNQLSHKDTIKLIEDANVKLIGSNTAVEYSVHEKTHQIMIKIVNSETKEVIKEIPSEKILDLVAKFCEMAGLMVDEKV